MSNYKKSVTSGISFYVPAHLLCYFYPAKAILVDIFFNAAQTGSVEFHATVPAPGVLRNKVRLPAPVEVPYLFHLGYQLVFSGAISF